MANSGSGTGWGKFLGSDKFMKDVNKDNERGVFITGDNIAAASARRAAHQRIKHGQGTAEDYVVVQEEDRLVRSISGDEEE